MRRLVLTALALGVVAAVLRPVLTARRWAQDDPALVDGLARAVAANVDAPWAFGTGSAHFDGEWGYATCAFTLVGLSHAVRADPTRRPWAGPAADTCAHRLLDGDLDGFGVARWGARAVDDPPERAHAYVGYALVGLAAWRAVDPEPAWAPSHDRLADRSRAALGHAVHAVETYPGEVYPPDQAMLAAGVAAHDRLTGRDSAAATDFLDRWATTIDPDSGFLHQQVVGRLPVDPRGSGTAVAAWALRDAAPALSRRLHAALVHQSRAVTGVREYPPGVNGWGDIDSGPVVLGLGVTATGFGIGAARAHGDPRAEALTRTAELFGVPVRWNGGRTFLTGATVGDAILLAMLTTPRPGDASQPAARAADVPGAAGRQLAPGR